MTTEAMPYAHTLFTGLTRPAMYMGVTLQFFVLSFFPSLISYILLGSLLHSALFFAVLYVFGAIACKIDERIFEIIIGRLQIRCMNRHYWGCNSYDPT